MQKDTRLQNTYREYAFLEKIEDCWRKMKDDSLDLDSH